MTSPSLARRARSALFVALRAVFRSIPMRESTRDAVRSKLLRAFPTVRPLPAQGQAVTTIERRPRVRADERCIGYVEYSEEPLPDPLPATLVAFYLPQFHTIPENDQWWGKGFTEWRNVTRALPQFEGHLQPRLPGDLGFYDLRNPQVMRDQAKLAKTYGLSAFCFYFYWFGGKTLLEEPLRNWLADKSIDFQYCLCWANENWTRRWDGRDDEILIAQKHSPEDDIAFIEYVADYLRDPRYLRVDGKPMLLLYRPMLLPDPKATAERWRMWCRENGIGEIHLAYVQSFERPEADSIGFDAGVGFPPNLATAPDITGQCRLLDTAYRGEVLDWRALPQPIPSPIVAREIWPGVNCGWDNEPRRPGRGRTFRYATPTLFSKVLRSAVDGSERKVIFINAWNEWAEGAVLEPDASRGYAALAAARRALASEANVAAPVVLVHAWHPELLDELLDAVVASALECRYWITTGPSQAPEVRSVLERRGLPYDLLISENRGRDILPMLRVVSALLSAGDVDCVLKLHTKRSPHRTDGERWRRDLVSRLLEGAPATARAFRDQPDLGAVAVGAHVVSVGAYVGGNAATLGRISQLTGVPVTDADLFPAGSMYWVRPAALAPLIEAPLYASDFEDEVGQVDGTLAHAIERMVFPTIRSAGFRCEIAGVSAGASGYAHADVA